MGFLLSCTNEEVAAVATACVTIMVFVDMLAATVSPYDNFINDEMTHDVYISQYDE